MDVGRELVNEIFGTAFCRKSLGENCFWGLVVENILEGLKQTF